MIKFSKHASAIAFISLIGISAAVGFSIPSFYAWTGSEQSRPSPLLWKVPVWSAIGIAIFCCALPWWPTTSAAVRDRQVSPRFGLRTLLILTTFVALAIPAFIKFPIVASSIVLAIAAANVARVTVQAPRSILPAIALVACMILPYGWVVRYSELDRILPTLTRMFAGLPMFLPASILGAYTGQPILESHWIGRLLTACELTLGIWLIRLGPKRATSYSLYALLVAAFGSLVFYQLCVF
ncbi:MAG: hypothetical protein AAGJ40_14145 [Planctomycetota bacterium]